MHPSRYTVPSPSFQPFWEDGRGKQLIQQLAALPELSEMEAFVPNYFKVDELADAVIQETF